MKIPMSVELLPILESTGALPLTTLVQSKVYYMLEFMQQFKKKKESMFYLSILYLNTKNEENKPIRTNH